MVITSAMAQQRTVVLERKVSTSAFRVNAQKYGFRPRCRPLAHQVVCKALSLNCGETTVTFNIEPENVQRLNEQVNALLKTFADKQKAERPQRWQSLEFLLKGDAEKKEPQLVEIFCNPNAHGTAFEAKVLVTVKTADGVKVTTEGKLTAFKADLDTHLS